MRRAAALITVFGLMMFATAALGAVEAPSVESQSYKDLFGSVSYSGSDGSIFWESAWKEVGESDGPSEGSVHVDIDPFCPDYKCLHISGQGETYSLIGTVRYADLSEFEEAVLSYNVKRLFDEDLEGASDAELLVQVSNDGSKWKTIDSFALETTDSSPIHKTRGINSWISSGFAVRFAATGTLSAEVFIDDVEIKGAFAHEGTTKTTTEATTTTKPRSATTTTERSTTTTEATTTTTTRGTTTTSESATTTTTVVAVVAPPAIPPPGSGIRETASGVQADYSSGLFGSMEMGRPEVLGVELNADYKMAVEVIESSWVWMIGLLVVIAGAIVTGLDRRRTSRIPPDG